MTRVSESIARPARTGIQMGVGGILVEFADAFGLGLDDRQYAISVIVAGLVVGFLQVVVENRFGSAVLRRVPPTTTPLVDGEAGHSDSLTLIVVAVLLLVILLALGVVPR